MENHALNPIIVLRVKTSCCKKCPGKVQKALMKLEGVHRVAVDPEKRLVSIRGHMDPLMLIKAIAKLGKRAELIFYDKEPKNEDYRQHKNAQSSTESHLHIDDHDPNIKQNDREKHFCCRDDDSPSTVDFNHKTHDYCEVPRKEDEEDILKHPHIRFGRSASTNRRVPLRDNNSPNTDDLNHEDHEYREVPKKGDEDDLFKHPCFRFGRNASTNRHVPSRDDDSSRTGDFNHEAHEYREVPKKEDEDDIFKHPYFRFGRSASTNRRVPSRDDDHIFRKHTDHHKKEHFCTQSSRYDTRNSQYSRWFNGEPTPNHTDHHKQAHFRAQSSRFDTRNPQYSQWFSKDPSPYDHNHSRMPPPPPPTPHPPSPPTYSYGSLGADRPISDIDNFFHYFSAENPNGCMVM